MRKPITLALLIVLTACYQHATVRQSIAAEAERYRRVCYKNAEFGHFKTVSQVIRCEAENVMASAITSGFDDLEGLANYYKAREALAADIDKKKVSLKQAPLIEQEIDSEYAYLFQDKKGDKPTAFPLSFDVEKLYVYYGLVN